MFIVNLHLLTTLITFIPFREVGKNLVVPGGARVIDAQKKLVIPGNNIKENTL